MTLPETSRLAIADVVFYIPALILSIIIVVRHGFDRQLGWVFLTLLALIRLIGNSEEIAANVQHSNGLFIAAAVMNGLGLGPLLLAMIGMLKRVEQAVSQNRVNANRSLLQVAPARFLNLSRIALLVALILAAVGSAKLYSSDHSEHSQGTTLARAGIVIFQTVLAASIFRGREPVNIGERRILYAVIASVPFLAVRLLYSLLVFFDTTSSTFTLRGGNIWVRSFMSVAEEWITVILYLAAGLAAPRIARGELEVSPNGEAYGLVESEPAHDKVYSARQTQRAV
ncbi:MAG: hypothetical protein L6R38_006068 [Xanthoria sp. 2 TBL-2021]|nr:MAG: hypothetical protein L6R38_006068 [Xanthoria sp. 2 TBL-2021]